tara:strand:- start:961 stop:1311 length:351 start_codon:yes stop_codon:yes gene_type:complete
MGISRYNKRRVIKNNAWDYAYSKIFRNRGLHTATQFAVAELAHLTVAQVASLTIESKMWTMGEKYFKLAYEFYGDPQYWWVIAWYNQKPLESDFIPGDVVEIPTPIEQVLEYLEIL